MPAIWRIRLTNIQYDSGRKAYNDELFRLRGDNTLFTLANGGGKTLLVQLLLQVVLPNERFNNRPLSDLLAHQHYTGHIAVEWRLDGDEASYLTTGFCFTRGQDDGDPLRYFMYTIGYEQANSFDIKHLPLTNQERVPISYHELLTKLKQNLNHQQARITIFDQDDKKSAYQRELASYHIFPKEWKNIKVINNKEGGVEGFFAAAQNSRQLLDHLIIPAVEEVLFPTREDSRQLAESFQQYYRNLIHIPELRQNLTRFKLLRQGGEEVLRQVRDYAGNQQSYLTIQEELRRLFNSAGSAIKIEEAALADLERELAELSLRLGEINYQLDSLPWLALRDELQQAEAAGQAAQAEVERCRDQLSQADYRLRRAKGENWYQELREYQSEIASWEEARRLQSAGHEEQLARLDSCRATVRALLAAEETKLVEQSRELQAAMEALRRREWELKKEQSEGKRRQLEYVQQITKAQEKNRDYRQERDRLLEQYLHLVWIEDPEQGILFWSDQQGKTERRLVELQQERVDLHRRQDELSTRLLELAAELTARRNRRDQLEREQTGYQRAVDNLVEQLRCHAISCSDPFSDSPRIQASLAGLILSLQEKIRKQSAELKRLEEELDLLRNFDFYIPNRELLRLQQLLQEHQVPSQTGSQWLAGQCTTPDQKTAYLQRNPLLPYSLVIDEADFKRLQGLQQIWQGLLLDSPVPLVVRSPQLVPEAKGEQLERLPLIDGRCSYAIWHKGYRFVISEDSLAEEAERLEQEIAGKREQLAQADLGLKDLHRAEQLCQQFYQSYTPGSASEISGQLALVNEFIAAGEQEQAAAQAEGKRIKTRLAALEDELGEAGKELATAETARSDFQQWRQHLAEWQDCRSRLEQLRGSRQELEQKLAAIERELEQLADRRVAGEGKRVQLAGLLTNIRDDIAAVPRPQNEQAPLLDLPYDQARVVLQTVQGEVDESLSQIKGYDQLIARNRREIERVKRRINREARLELSALAGSRLHHTDEELDRLEQELQQRQAELTEAEHRCNQCSNQVTELRTKLEMLRQNIVKNHHREPCTSFSTPPDLAEATLQAARGEAERALAAAREKQEAKRVTIVRYKAALEKMATLISVYGVAGGKELLTEQQWQESRERLEERIDQLANDLKRLRDELTRGRNLVKNAYRDYAAAMHSQNSPILDKFINQLLEDESKQFDLKEIEPCFNNCFELIAKYEEKALFELEECERDKKQLVERCVRQAEQVAEEIRTIDRYVRVDYADRNVSVCQIKLQEWEPQAAPLVMENHISDCINKLKEMEGEPEEKSERFIAEQLSSRQLLHTLSNLNHCVVKVLKPEQHPDTPRFDNWDNVQKWSGGERFAGYTAMFMAILSYTRSKMSSLRNPRKVLVADNPFGAASSPHVLELIFQLAKNNNIQMICLTALTEETIFSFFPVVYSLRLRQFLGKDYVQSRMESGFYDIDPLEEELERTRQLRLEW